jgi:hypothetical protein
MAREWEVVELTSKSGFGEIKGASFGVRRSQTNSSMIPSSWLGSSKIIQL